MYNKYTPDHHRMCTSIYRRRRECDNTLIRSLPDRSDEPMVRVALVARWQNFNTHAKKKSSIY